MESVLHEDHSLDFVVLSKPPGIDTYEFVRLATGQYLDKSWEKLRSELTERRKRNGYAPSAVHRLDKPTSGCLLVGITASARRRLCNLLERRSVQKTYYAVVCGEVLNSHGKIEAQLLEERRATEDGCGYSCVRVDSKGKPAVTVFDVLARSSGYSLLALQPITGRTHQLRVHCAEVLRAPILGDRWYPAANNPKQDLHLHAARIHLQSEMFKQLSVEAPLPPHMECTVNKLWPEYRQLLAVSA